MGRLAQNQTILLAIRTIYGMNFDRIPELSGLLGYPVGLALMVSVCASALSGLQRRGWL